MAVAILALQGAFREHAAVLETLSVPYTFIRSGKDLDTAPDALILPGGESTVQRRLAKDLGLLDPLRSLIQMGIPVLGTCAGLILLAQEIAGGEEAVLGTLPVTVCRNAYGRQLGSFSSVGDVGSIPDFPQRFIRAPYIDRILTDDVEILSRTDGRITAVRYKNQIGTAFHPELTGDVRIHRMLLR